MRLPVLHHPTAIVNIKGMGWYEKKLQSNPSFFKQDCSSQNNEICAPGPEKPRRVVRQCRVTNVTAVDYVNGPLGEFKCRCGAFPVTLAGRNGTIKLPLIVHPKTKVCLGSVGYPCKSNPLFRTSNLNHSCVTGYCDLETDSCEYIWDIPDVSYASMAPSILFLDPIILFFIVILISENP